MNENELKGDVREGVGKVKDAYGGLTGDTKTQAEGKLDQASGKIQAQFGDVKEKLDDAADAATEKASEVASRFGSRIREVSQKITPKAAEYGEQISEAAATANRAVSKGIEEQPLLALLLAGAIGYGISFLAHSPSSPFAPQPPLRRAMSYARRFR